MQRKKHIKLSKKSGTIPGSLIHIGEKKSENQKVTIFDYDTNELIEKEIVNMDELLTFREKPTVTWINIDGLHEVKTIEKIGSIFEIHPLVLEDILNTKQRPKTEDFTDYVFIAMKMLSLDKNNMDIISEQFSMILGKNFVISFQEFEGDVFKNVRDRIRTAKGRIRRMKSDYLTYSLVDAIIDNYFGILENFGEKIETLEDIIIESPQSDTLEEIYKLKRTFINLRKSVWPLRELISSIIRDESELFTSKTNIYFRDVYDHTIQVIDTIESYREMVSGMLDIYLSSMSNKMNEIMKVLTIFAAIFIPLTFLAGIYGMNFKFLPELNWKWAYPVWWILALVIGIGMLLYFKKKKWL